jgi:predicted  nucleic acid-binding Zn-ribbon protein
MLDFFEEDDLAAGGFERVPHGRIPTVGDESQSSRARHDISYQTRDDPALVAGPRMDMEPIGGTFDVSPPKPAYEDGELVPVASIVPESATPVKRWLGHQVLPPTRPLPEYYLDPSEIQDKPAYPKEMVQGDFAPEPKVSRYMGASAIPAGRHIDPMYQNVDQWPRENPIMTTTERQFIGFEDVLASIYGRTRAKAISFDLALANGHIGADIAWKEYKIPTMPSMKNTQNALDNLSKSSTDFFKSTINALQKTPDFKPPEITLKSLDLLGNIQFTMPAAPKVPSVTEIDDFIKSIDTYAKSISTLLTTTKNNVEKIATTKFKDIPNPFKHPIEAVNHITYNFNHANDVFKTVKTGVNSVVVFAGGTASFFQDAVKKSADLIKKFPSTMSSFVGEYMGNIQTSLTNFVSGISKDAAKFTKDQLAQIESSVKIINDYISALNTKIQTWINSVMTALQKDITAAMTSINKNMTAIMTGIQKDVEGFGKWLLNTISGLGGNVKDNIGKFGDYLTTEITGNLKKFQDSITTNLKVLQDTIMKDAEKAVNGWVKTAQNQIQSLVTDNLNQFRNTIGQEQAKLTEQLKRFNDQLAAGTQQMNTMMGNLTKQGELVNLLDQKLGKSTDLTSLLDQKVGKSVDFMSMLDQRVAQQGQVVGTVDLKLSKSNELVNLLEQQMSKQGASVDAMNQTVAKQKEAVSQIDQKILNQAGLFDELQKRVNSLEIKMPATTSGGGW